MRSLKFLSLGLMSCFVFQGVSIAQDFSLPLGVNPPMTAPSQTAVTPAMPQVSQSPLNVIDPTASSSGTASAFPGYRGANQLVMYDSGYAQPSTGTNEFGFEVTVLNGRVVEQEGSDSRIPAQNGFVLSGHGVARAWLLAHAPLGAHIDIDLVNKMVTSRVEYDTYRYQMLRRLDVTKDSLTFKDRQRVNEALDRMDQLNKAAQAPAAIALAQETMNWLDQMSWQRANVYSNTAIRGAWHRPVEKDAAAIEATVLRLQKAGLNTIFLETFYHGYPIFPSKTYEQAGLGVNQYPAFTGWDPLEAWVRIAHAHGMKLHVWFQSFYVGTDAVSGAGPILKKHPEWSNVQYSALTKLGPQSSSLEKGAYFADPAHPEARQFLLTLLQEMVERYPVDGVQLDYMDYPMSFSPDRPNYLQTTWGYSAVARKAFQAEVGVDPVVLTPSQTALWQQWTQFKERQVNEYMQEAAQRIRQSHPAQHPPILISATAFAKLLESKIKKHEDWALWAEKGWIDFLAPMLLTSSVKVVQSDTVFVRSNSNGAVPVVSGIFSPFNGSGPETLMDQVVAAHQGGAVGFSIFDTAHLDEHHRLALQTAFNRVPVLHLTTPVETQRASHSDITAQ